ncbi:MAG: hypothetical protein A4S16_11650 [Proteobacteria bacterium SG_bin6]|nr:MAG: hypothetical protein A4S16_11650 [Proteobacteria bacterium SG_bin6]
MSLKFLGQFLRHPRSTGAVWPSSPALARAMAAAVPRAARLIVEYGPGTGVFTAALRRAHPQARLIAIEYNPAFHAALAARFAGDPLAEPVLGSAADVAAILAARGLGAPEAIVSGLPFTSLPAALGETILAETARLLGAEGRFVLFQYSRARIGLISRHFARIEARRVWANLPPAWVLGCDNR